MSVELCEELVSLVRAQIDRTGKENGRIFGVRHWITFNVSDLGNGEADLYLTVKRANVAAVLSMARETMWAPDPPTGSTASGPGSASPPPIDPGPGPVELRVYAFLREMVPLVLDVFRTDRHRSIDAAWWDATLEGLRAGRGSTMAVKDADAVVNEFYQRVKKWTGESGQRKAAH